MLINTDITIAYKCVACGTFEFISVNLFRLFHQRSIEFNCRCNNSSGKIIRTNQNEYEIKIPCIGCGSEHSYTIDKRTLLRGELQVYCCQTTQLKQCFVGPDVRVRQSVDSFERELDYMMDNLGYDSFFENSQVMLDTLNKLHDLAEKGNLLCRCGCSDAIINLRRKGIFLRCSRCNGSKFIPAASNNDLKVTLNKASIILNNDQSQLYKKIYE